MLHPDQSAYSHYYMHGSKVEATRIDRSYVFGGLVATECSYKSIAFSDHMAYVNKINLPSSMSHCLTPKFRPVYKITPVVARDQTFQDRLAISMQEWNEVRNFGVPVLLWWEQLVKPGVRKLALNRNRELNKERKSLLNLLTLRQSYLTRKLQKGSNVLEALKRVHFQIENWFLSEVEKIKHQARVDDIQISEKVRIYHHELHQKHIKKSSILKLQHENMTFLGHQECMNYLQSKVSDLLEKEAQLDVAAQEALLNDVGVSFSDSDNQLLTALPTKEEVKESVRTANDGAAPVSDGISNLVYHTCFNIIGDALTDVIQAVFKGQRPTKSQRTSLMIFSAKPGKTTSLKPSDKRRISLLNTDFKIITGIEHLRYKKLLTHTLSPTQLAYGTDRRITSGICLARDAINAAGKRKQGCAIADNDFEAAFDFLCLNWVKKVLRKKGLCDEALQRFSNIYDGGITIPVVNNEQGRPISNKRLSLRQGDRPSGNWFCYGIDPLLVYLEKRLEGILIYSTPISGPSNVGQPTLFLQQKSDTEYKAT